MLELHLIRHGQTEFSLQNRFCGSIDPPLDRTGLAMAEAFGAAWSARGPIDAIYSSPSLRARQTGGALGSRLGLELRLDEGLREISYGEWEGLRHEDARAKWPDLYAYWTADTASRATPGGETAFQVAGRAAPVLDRIQREHPQGRVFIVSHKATIRILVCALLGMDVRRFRDRIAQPVAAVTSFEIRPSGPLLVRLGDTSHLPPELHGLEGT